MISNKYGFIYIHTPKAGGTSVNTALYADTDRECRITHEKKGGGIACMYPSLKDFPWWDAWISHAAIREHTAVKANACLEPYLRNAGRGCTFTVVGADVIFSGVLDMQDVGSGNIKHLPLRWWVALMNDPRIAGYKSFRDEYIPIGSCRNPYTREFSWFWYQKRHSLLERAEEISSTKKIKQMIRKEWEEWIIQIIDPLPTPDKNLQRAKQVIGGMPSQAHYLHMEHPITCLLSDIPVPKIRMHQDHVAHFIRMEHIEEDYNEVCKLLSIPRKTSTMPHKLNLRAKSREYVPDNILEWYTDEMMDVIHKLRAADFEILPYEMGRPIEIEVGA